MTATDPNWKDAEVEMTIFNSNGTFFQRGEKYFRVNYDDSGEPSFGDEVSAKEVFRGNPKHVIPIVHIKPE